LLTLQSKRVRVSVDPAFGARVVSLVDRRTGREWMSPGERDFIAGEDAVYGAREAAGWDECFPTVAACEAGGGIWERRLRDHGDLWGRSWNVDSTSGEISTSFQGDRFRFARTLTLVGDRLIANYALTNTSDDDLPYLWSQHALLSVSPADTIALSGVERLDVSHLVFRGEQQSIDRLVWPANSVTGAPARLDQILAANAGFCLKAYAPVLGEFRATVGDSSGGLELAWSASDAPFLGLWLNSGGWPTPGACPPQLAIEPTTSPADHLNGAAAADLAPRLAPRQTRHWRVTMRVTTLNAVRNQT
jgi:galactose mutarotase-like enzyme